MLTTIHITVRDRVPTITAGEDVISHNSDYVAEFVFDEEWQDKVKTVYFVCEDGSYQAVVMSGNSCGVPMLDGEHRRIFVGVQAGAAEKSSVLKTTRPCCLKVKDSIADYLGQPIPDPTPDVYEQIIAMLNNLTTPTWAAMQNKPFESLGDGLEVDENGVLSAKGGGGSPNAVQYVAQELTDEQKTQARENIGAKAATEKSAYIISVTRSYGYIHTSRMDFDGVYALIQSGKVVMLLVDNSATYYGVITPTNETAKTIMFYNIRDMSQSDVGGRNKGITYFGFAWHKGDDSLTEWWGDIPSVEVDETLTKSGSAADAKAVGDALKTKADIADIPDVPAWALADEKPTYTAAEVGALPNTTVIPPAYTLPQATADALGGIKADAATAEDTQPVRIGADGKLKTKPTSGTSITVDSALSSTSTNPVQNKVVTAALTEKITAPTTAAVGQIIKVKSVDTLGKPTEWEAADLPSGGEKKQFAVIFEQLLDDSTVVSIDDDGTYNEAIIELICPPGMAVAFSKFTIIFGVGNKLNNIAIANASGNNKGFWLHVTRCIDTDGNECIQGEYMSVNMANAATITAKAGFNNQIAKAIISPTKTDAMIAGILFKSAAAIPAGAMLRISAK